MSGFPDMSLVTSPELLAALEESRIRYDAMTPEEKAEVDRKQRESWIRAFGPCDHGVLDFEECPQCRGDA